MKSNIWSWNCFKRCILFK